MFALIYLKSRKGRGMRTFSCLLIICSSGLFNTPVAIQNIFISSSFDTVEAFSTLLHSFSKQALQDKQCVLAGVLFPWHRHVLKSALSKGKLACFSSVPPPSLTAGGCGVWGWRINKENPSSLLPPPEPPETSKNERIQSLRLSGPAGRVGE